MLSCSHKTVFANAPAMGKIGRDFGHAFSFASSSSRGIMCDLTSALIIQTEVIYQLSNNPYKRNRPLSQPTASLTS